METLLGRVHNGVVVLPTGASLPEGSEVTVSYPRVSASSSTLPKRRVILPLVDSDEPGTLHLTAEDIAELLDDEDVSS